MEPSSLSLLSEAASVVGAFDPHFPSSSTSAHQQGPGSTSVNDSYRSVSALLGLSEDSFAGQLDLLHDNLFNITSLDTSSHDAIARSAPADDIAALEQVEIDRALRANVAYNQGIMNATKHLEKVIERMEDLQVFVRELHGELASNSQMSVVAPNTQQVTLPWFKHYHGKDLPPNPEGELRSRHNKLVRFVPWTVAERKALFREVVSVNKQRFARDLAQHDPNFMATIGRMSENEAAEHYNDIDWDLVAKQIPRRTPYECRIRWLHHDRPSVNHGKWSKDELEQLYAIADAHGQREWQAISDELGTARSPVECLRQYRQRVAVKEKWSKEEDDALREAVKLHGENWQAVARHVGRHSNQCINRWTKTIRPNIKKGRWAHEEDEALRHAVAACGLVWKNVAKRVSGRTDAQCRERWCNILDPKVLNSKAPWSEEEDQLLVQTAAENSDKNGKPRWNDVSKALGGKRTDNHCLRRYKELIKIRPAHVATLIPVNPLVLGNPTLTTPNPPLTKRKRDAQAATNGEGSDTDAPEGKRGKSRKQAKSSAKSGAGRKKK